jgi:hypothetical protein
VEWLALVVWIVIALIALPIGAFALAGLVGLGLQAAAVGAGTVFSALYIIFDGPRWAGWLTVAMAAVALVASVQGAAQLTSGDRPASADTQDAEELASGLLGVEIPMLFVALGCSLCLGFHFITLT